MLIPVECGNTCRMHILQTILVFFKYINRKLKANKFPVYKRISYFSKAKYFKVFMRLGQWNILKYSFVIK